jgi:hypothetical protein
MIKYVHKAILLLLVNKSPSNKPAIWKKYDGLDSVKS